MTYSHRPTVTRMDGLVLPFELKEIMLVAPETSFAPPSHLNEAEAMDKIGAVIQELKQLDLAPVLHKGSCERQRIAYACGGLLMDFRYMRPGIELDISYPFVVDKWEGAKEFLIFRDKWHDAGIGGFEFIARGYSEGKNMSAESREILRTMQGEARRACGYLDHFVARAMHFGVTRYIER